MDKQLVKRGSIVVASALTIFGLSVASPSIASTAKNTTHTATTTKKSSATATPAPSTGGNLSWGNGAGAGAGAGQGDDDGVEGPENHGQGGDHGKGPKGDHGKGPWGAPANLTDQTVTVNVPADSSTYVAVITEVPAAAQAPATGSVATPPAAPARPAHVDTVAVSGTGAQTITFKGIAGQAYTVQLVKVVSTQVYTGK